VQLGQNDGHAVLLCRGAHVGWIGNASKKAA
jgi:hypothetical protein